MANDSGVHIGGDANLTRSAISGRDANVVNSDTSVAAPADLAQLRRDLVELLDQVHRAGDELPDKDGVAANVNQALQEADKQEPDQSRLKGILQAVSQAVTGFGSLANTATAIDSSIDAIFSD